MNTPDNDDLTHFGYETVAAADKAKRVGEVFHSVANKYNVMNDVMSLGMHRLWKKFAMQHTGLKHGDVALDLAGGTGDLTKVLSKQVGHQGKVILSDINASMLRVGRDKLTDVNIVENVEFVQANAELLPFSDNTFQAVTISFGLRNVTDKLKALRAMHRVLKPGGKVLVLEFSTPKNPLLKKIYDAYSFSFIPKFGEYIAKDKASYQYLVESIRMHPDQEKMLALLEEAGFENSNFYSLSGGIVALHYGYKVA
jgi:demethylmenaquinone methyltransferase/2-methoxy-6-polyprenyl-1,4-benzoquinol methylase